MSAIFGDDDPPAPIIQVKEPAPPAPVPRADPNDPANREARRRAIEALASGGRRSLDIALAAEAAAADRGGRRHHLRQLRRDAARHRSVKQ